LGYAKRFSHVLETKGAQSLLKLSHGSKVHTIKALASLAKFLGRHDDWLDIIKRHHLKWSRSDNSAKVFRSIFEPEVKNLQSMIKWIRDVSATLPIVYRYALCLTLTGSRPDEAQNSIFF
jgi:hypothetical protein